MTDLTKVPRNISIPDKAVGVWVIPDLGVKVPVYKDTHSIQANAQIVDAENSALYQPYLQAYIISDHAGSSDTWFMEKATLDMDAYFVRPSITVPYTTHYSCYAILRADYHPWGYTQNGQMVTPRSSKDIVCVSCVDSKGKEVYMAIFREAGRVNWSYNSQPRG